MPVTPARRSWSLFMVLLVAFQPAIFTGCVAPSADKRILQYLNTEGFGKRYTGVAEEENYVGIGDVVTFVDTYNPTVVGTAAVDIDGTIQLPEAGTVTVAGLTRTELESYLTQKLSPYFLQTDVRVSIQAGAGRVYYVVGQVAAPGPRPFTGDITVFDAVLAAVPNQHQANLARVKLIRADPRDPLIITINVSEMWETGDSTTNVHLREFDILYVPPTFLQQIADFLSAILVPITSVLGSIYRTIFLIENDGQFGRGRRSFV